MVDVSKLKPGDRVSFVGHGNAYIDAAMTVSGIREYVNVGTVFTVANPAIEKYSFSRVRLESPRCKDGILPCEACFLDVVPTDDAIANIHAMRSAGPPAPASCGCDIMSLMRVGCRCGYLAKERGASS